MDILSHSQLARSGSSRQSMVWAHRKLSSYYCSSIKKMTVLLPNVYIPIHSNLYFSKILNLHSNGFCFVSDITDSYEFSFYWLARIRGVISQERYLFFIFIFRTRIYGCKPIVSCENAEYSGKKHLLALIPSPHKWHHLNSHRCHLGHFQNGTCHRNGMHVFRRKKLM